MGKTLRPTFQILGKVYNMQVHFPQFLYIFIIRCIRLETKQIYYKLCKCAFKKLTFKILLSKNKQHNSQFCNLFKYFKSLFNP